MKFQWLRLILRPQLPRSSWPRLSLLPPNNWHSSCPVCSCCSCSLASLSLLHLDEIFLVKKNQLQYYLLHDALSEPFSQNHCFSSGLMQCILHSSQGRPGSQPWPLSSPLIHTTCFHLHLRFVPLSRTDLDQEYEEDLNNSSLPL